MHELTRQELFEAAWTEPLTKVAARFGVTSTALKKTCDRHDIPTPSRGYWRAVETGLSFARPPLPAISDPKLERIRIMGAPSQSKEVAEALKTTKAIARAAGGKVAASHAAHPIEAGERRELSATKAALGRAKMRADGFLSVSGRNVIPSVVGPMSAARLLTCAGLLLDFAEPLGGRLKLTASGAHLLFDGEAIAFRFAEKAAQTPHQPTTSELAEQARRKNWGYARTEAWPKYDNSPSGQLSIVIEANSYSGLRRTYADGKTQTLERMMPEIIGAFAAHAALEKERRNKAEVARLKREADEARRRELAAFHEREKRRTTFVGLVSERLGERARLHDVVAHIETQGADAERLGSMARWLKGRLSELDALLSPTFLDLSARAAEIDFREPPAPSPEDQTRFYAPPVELHWWAIDLVKDEARTQSATDWAATVK